MSRCFPYPPPGYEKSLALIESIKLQKEREKTEKERKKREKKEKKDKPKGDRPKSEEKKKHKKRHREEPSKSTRKPEDENEQLERSSLTEEHGCPAAAAQILYDSSDSTQDSSKRIVPLQDVISSEPSAPNKAIKRSRPDLSDVTAQGAAKRIRQDPADAAAAAHGLSGSGIRIRLPLLRHAESPTASGDQPCFSGRTSEERAAAPPPSYSGPPSFSGRPAEIVSSAAEQRPGETSLRDDPKQRKQSSKSSRKSSGGRAQEIHRQYKKLVRDWTPPPLLAERPLDEDLDWLAERRQGPAAAAAVDGGEGPLCLRPGRASYAPEFGVHVLPYVVPF